MHGCSRTTLVSNYNPPLPRAACGVPAVPPIPSNMNYCLDVSDRTMEVMEQQGLSDPALALSMVQEAAEGEFLAGGDLTMGTIILLVDSDTR